MIDRQDGLCYYSKVTPTPESPAIYGGDEWLSGSEFRPATERRNYTEKKPRALARGVFTNALRDILEVINNH